MTADITPEAVARWQYCPECGCEELRHEEGDHKQCKQCKQEWFADIDYSAVVHGRLKALSARVAESEAELVVERKMLDENWVTHQSVVHARSDLATERAALQSSQTYAYIGKDGKTVLARDLEDERDALSARVKELEAGRDRWKEQHSAEALGLHVQMIRAEAAEAENARLRDALTVALPHLDENARYLRDMQAHAGKVKSAFDAAKNARAALQETKL